MTDSDFTLTTPLSDLGGSGRPLLALTIVWHPDPGRVGEQFVGAGAGMAGTEALALNRFAPLFRRPGGDGLGLGVGAVSREPLRIARDAGDGVRIAVPASRMAVELNGRVIEGEVCLDAAQVEAGQVLTLGRAVVLCLHWMDCLPRQNPVPGVAGVGSAAIALRDQIRMVAPTDLPVLLLGETGTGKDIAARAIHALGERRKAPMVSVNMATLGESLAAADLFGAVRGAYTGAQSERRGLFADADGGTLFLDEIGNAPASVQPMLLRVLEGGVYRPLGASQDRQSSARLIAATDQDLDKAEFNQALLRRLEGFTIQMPPLRARREDIGVLVLHLLQAQGAAHGMALALPAGLLAEFASYDWPGNVRQLAHALKRAVLLAGNGMAPRFDQLVRMPSATGSAARASMPEPAPEPTPEPAPPPARMPRRKPSELSEDEVLDAMARHGWTILAAAKALGISRPTMYKLLEGHSRIRPAERIPAAEIERALTESGGDVARCAGLLQTPAEALRRHLRRQDETEAV
jgi:two-component system nitrogen regulation response regulator GlnG